MMKKTTFLVFLTILLSINITYAQCTGGTASGSFTPNSNWQTLAVSSGNYYTFNAANSGIYIFSFCQGGGSASYDTQINILNTSNVNIGYNDDNCGTSSEYTFVAPAAGTYRLYITEWNCLNSAKAATIAYRLLVYDNICSAYYLSSTNCSCTNYLFSNGGATNSPQTNPGCFYNNNDVWIKTRVPFSGQISITASAGTMTDGAMAVYSSSTNSCTGTLTSLGCDDNSGPGNMPQMNFTTLTPGDSIFIRFWAKNGVETGTFNICIQDLAPMFCMSGDATEMYPSRCVQITPNAQGKAGCVWNNSKINLAADFDYTFTVFLGSNNGGADGITFAMQDNPAGTTACGTTGQGLGMGGITRSVTVEFDTFDNSAMGYTEIAADHIAISLNGNIAAPVSGPVQASASSVNIEDGVNHTVRIVWTQSSKTFQIYFDGSLRLTYVNDFVTNVFSGTSNVYWGMTGSTGLFYNQQTLCPGNLPGSPLPLTFFNGFLRNERDIEFNWTYLKSEEVRRFTLEQSSDGINFQAVYMNEQINPAANNRYSHTLGNVTEAAYYRLVTDKKSGNSEVSSIIYIDPVKLRGNEYEIFPNPAQSDVLNIVGQEDEQAEVVIRNMMGDEVARYTINKLYNTLSLPSGMSNGSYLVSITTVEKSHNYHYTLSR